MSATHTPGPVFLDSFSGQAADLKPSQRTPRNVFAALSKDARVSAFDLSEKPWLVSCIEILERDGLIVEDKSEPYPWHKFVIAKAEGA